MSFLVEAFKGLQAHIEAEGEVHGHLHAASGAVAIFCREVAALFQLIPAGLNAANLHRRLSPLDSYIKAGGNKGRVPYAVLLAKHQSYGSGPRHVMDVYVPQQVAARLNTAPKTVPLNAVTSQPDKTSTDANNERKAQPAQDHTVGNPAGAPVVFFSHGGVWASGDPWHYVHMATNMAQQGCVVCCHTYTLYPDAQAPQMVQEVSAALSWTLDNISQYGGDPARVTAIGHSAGGHLLALALMQRAGIPIGPDACGSSYNAGIVSSPNDIESGQSTLQTFVNHNLDGRMPSRVIGWSGVYDIAKHYEHERSRGVHFLSMMSRAMGGPAAFASLSPAVLLHTAADLLSGSNKHQHQASAQLQAGGVTGVQLEDVIQPLCNNIVSNNRTSSSPYVTATFDTKTDSSISNGISNRNNNNINGVNLDYFNRFVLQGEAIPCRAGLTDKPIPSSHDVPLQSQCSQKTSSTTQQTGLTEKLNSSKLLTSTSQLQGLERLHSAGKLDKALARLPPFYIAMGCADYVVPWHEGAEMVAALQRCGIPAKHLMYQHADHPAFVMQWKPSYHPDNSRQATTGTPGWIQDTMKLVHMGESLDGTWLREGNAGRSKL